MFKGQSKFSHEHAPGVGVLLLNVGTPDEPTTPALRRYLREFLSDTRIIEKPRWLWWIILNAFILPKRPKESAKLYQQVWSSEGSPLLVTSRKQTAELGKTLRDTLAGPIHIELGMRYGNPSVESALTALYDRGIDRLLVVPLYPQYSSTTTGTSFDAVVDVLKKWRWVPDFRFISAYHDHPSYIEALAESVQEVWKEHGKAQKLILSFHGIPRSYFLQGDPYHCHCYKTARLVREALGLSETELMLTFQSQFGREEWLQPYTIDTMKQLPTMGITNIQVMCPGFTSDCLETIEEIDVLNKEAFMHAGGKEFRYIPCLNARPLFIKALSEIAIENMQGWKSRPVATAQAKSLVDSESSKRRERVQAGNQAPPP